MTPASCLTLAQFRANCTYNFVTELLRTISRASTVAFFARTSDSAYDVGRRAAPQRSVFFLYRQLCITPFSDSLRRPSLFPVRPSVLCGGCRRKEWGAGNDEGDQRVEAHLRS